MNKKKENLAEFIKGSVKAWKRFKKKRKTERLSVKERFERIYENNSWSSKESKSGVGSELEYTALIRSWLSKKLPELDVKVFLDAPCGDFNWMQHVISDLEINYIGLDIVPEMIDTLSRKHSNNRVEFRITDIRHEKMPACDLIMVRDCLFHLSYEDIDSFLENLSRSDYTYLLTTNHKNDGKFKNEDVVTGGFRKIDLFLPPFNFPEEHILDRPLDNPEWFPVEREMVLIEKKHVPKKLSQSSAQPS